MPSVAAASAAAAAAAVAASGAADSSAVVPEVLGEVGRASRPRPRQSLDGKWPWSLPWNGRGKGRSRAAPSLYHKQCGYTKYQ